MFLSAVYGMCVSAVCGLCVRACCVRWVYLLYMVVFVSSVWYVCLPCTCGRWEAEELGCWGQTQQEDSNGSSPGACVKMSEPSCVTEMLFTWTRSPRDRLWAKGSTHNVPRCEHAVDYGTAERRHHPKAEEHDGRHQLGEEDRGVWSLNPTKPSLEHNQPEWS